MDTSQITPHGTVCRNAPMAPLLKVPTGHVSSIAPPITMLTLSPINVERIALSGGTTQTIPHGNVY